MTPRIRKKKALVLPPWERWANRLPEDLRCRLYRAPQGSPEGDTVAPVRLYGGKAEGAPLCAEVMLDVGWRVRTRKDADPTHHLGVWDEDGKDVTVDLIAETLRNETVRCYCSACVLPDHLDDERLSARRQALMLRCNVAIANGLRLEAGDEEVERKLDEILNGEEAGHASV